MICSARNVPEYVERMLARLPQFYDTEGGYIGGEGVSLTEEGFHIFGDAARVVHWSFSTVFEAGLVDLDEFGRYAFTGGFLAVDSSNVFKFTLVAGAEYDNLYKVTNSVLGSHQINNATGIQLDRLAKIFDLGRWIFTDNEFKRLILSAVTGLVGGGTIPNLRSAIAISLGIETKEVSIVEPEAGHVNVYIPFRYLVIQPELTGTAIKYKPAGIAIQAVAADEGVWDDTNWDECVWA